ncbi:MAG: GntR family transcriptional regulator [Lacrimispora sp.]
MQAREAKYMAVVQWVQEQIESGSIGMGDKLPSENEMSLQFHLSRQTVRHAIDVLEQQKLVTRIQGSGTYAGSCARGGRQEKYFNIAVISTYVDSYIFPAVLKGIERVLSKSGYTMQVAFTGNRTEREREALDKILEKGLIDGLIVEPAKSALPNPNLHYYRKLMEQQIPVLFFNSRYPELNLPCVSLNDVLVGEKAADYLIRAGHKEIGGIFKCDDGQGHLRYSGFARSMERAGLKLDRKRILWIDSESMKDMELWADYLFRRLEGSTGVVCYNDEVAYLLSGICLKRGIRIPEDLSLVSIDNSDLSTMGEVSITSFPHPMEALGRKTAENMINLIENPCSDGNYLFDSKAVERDSVKFISKENFNE